ncbi:hypothetical protein ACWEIJ_37995 [Lentzea sp. NPDC004789]
MKKKTAVREIVGVVVVAAAVLPATPGAATAGVPVPPCERPAHCAPITGG